jgi:neural Wiskott-Aldrich syndrome protein
MAEPFTAALPKIGTSQHLSQALEGAHKLALDQRQGTVTLEHLLYALTNDAEAGVVFNASQVNLERLRVDINGYLSRLPTLAAPSSDGTVRPNPDFLRILQAAAAAARQSPRKQIDGAIVLAAMIGDANTPAAGLLKAHGLTFEEAIKALQRANADHRTRGQQPKRSP